MGVRNRLTSSADETEVAHLFSGDHIFSIPYFQRPYRWKADKLKQLIEDLLRVVDGTTDVHFLGALILHGRRSNPSDPEVYDVIDGQQRITTLFLLLCAAIKTLCEHEEFDEAAALYQKYLAISRSTKLPSNVKVHSCKEDRHDLNDVFRDLLSDKRFVKHLGVLNTRLLPAAAADSRQIMANYGLAVDFFVEQVGQEGLDRLRALYTALLQSFSVIQINVSDPTDGPRIFDSLNSKQQPMTIGDLVRNDIFARVANQKPEVIEDIDDHHWQPFYRKFRQDGEDLFEEYFFPFGLIKNPNLKKSEVYRALRAQWGNLDPASIVADLAIYQNAFIDVACGTNLQKHPAPLAAAFRRLYDAGAPGVTFPFLMRVSQAIKDREISREDGIESLEVVESFLVRRAVCGHEPTGLHSVFKRLWLDCGEQPAKGKVQAAIRKHKTVSWPNDSELTMSIKKRPLYGSGIVSYFLAEFDRSLKGDQPSMVTWVEHVLPESPTPEWTKVFSSNQHKAMKDLVANLIPLSDKMNAGLRNSAYAKKRKVYLKDSAYKSARQFAEDHEEWSPEYLEKRSTLLASWSKDRWPY